MKKYNCPECYNPLNQHLTCKNGHHFVEKEGVLSLLKKTEAEKLALFLSKFEAYREKMGLRIKDESLYPQLPFVQNGLAGTSWKARKIDINYVFSELPKAKGLKILEIGAWNGWLSNQLAKAGHDVIAIDIFTDKYDGLGAMQFYPHKWTCIQMDIEAVDKVFSTQFNAIILNWGAAYIPDLPNYVDKLKSMLVQNGKLIFIGIAVYLDEKAKIAELAALNADFYTEYGINLFFKPCKGYLTWADKEQLEQKGFSLFMYPFFRSQFKAWYLKKGAVTFFAACTKYR